MAYEDPNVSYIKSLIDAADSSRSKESKKQDLTHALNAAKEIGHSDLVELIKDKLNSL